MKLDELFLEWLTLADTQGKLNSLLAMAAATPTKRKAEGSPAGAALMSANSKMKLDELFLEWLTLADTQGKLNSLLAGIRETKPLGTDSQQFAAAVQAGVTPLSPLAHIFKTPMIPSLAHTATQSPPRSPRSPRIQHRRPSRSGTGNPLAHAEPKSVLPPPKQHIPQFYFPMGKPPLPDQIQAELQRIQACFSHHGDAISKREDFLELCDVVCGMPMFMAGHLLTRLKSTEPTLSREKFLAWWSDNIRDCDAQARFFNCVRQKQNKFLCPEDFKGIMLELLETHSALEFLKATPEFQERYVETVILRIFYTVNRADNGRITLTELRRSNLVKVFKMVDEESDMNKITEFFSYEHFYVLYCKFWELDTDHDYELDKEDLQKYGNHSLTARVIDRIFAQAPRKFTCKTPNKMAYADFCWFLLCEEDKTSETSVEYWFRCLDMDGDGRLSTFELDYFYEEQVHRMECIGIDTVAFDDVLCQILDMIKPEYLGFITLRDMKRSRLAGHVCNMLFNLNKFIAYEQRDPLAIRHEHSTPELTDWDRFARIEYDLLAAEVPKQW
eukprot:TRINITY_DN3767_c0_g1_i3.p1 TRINITY_DN3767_c0_g1~~TRINITY_DN3767_c0_g1_i3.p1  ORF type:complete len:591 (-),score=122.58 TRINITY_DN3767_c0_g1_i3:132-1802(-)